MKKRNEIKLFSNLNKITENILLNSNIISPKIEIIYVL